MHGDILCPPQGVFEAAAAPPAPEGDDSAGQQAPPPLQRAPDALAAAESQRKSAEAAAARVAYEEDQVCSGCVSCRLELQLHTGLARTAPYLRTQIVAHMCGIQWQKALRLSDCLHAELRQLRQQQLLCHSKRPRHHPAAGCAALAAHGPAWHPAAGSHTQAVSAVVEWVACVALMHAQGAAMTVCLLC